MFEEFESCADNVMKLIFLKFKHKYFFDSHQKNLWLEIHPGTILFCIHANIARSFFIAITNIDNYAMDFVYAAKNCQQ